MIASLLKKFLRSRRAATAVAMALMTVPLLIAASAAVDFSRIASARTLLQASVDAAAVAGAGAYQTSQSYSAAQNVAQAAYSGTGAQLPNFVTPVTVTIGAYCSSLGSTTQCGSGTSSTSLSGKCPSGWNSNKEYCVVATATVTLKNSLFAWLIPSEALSATGIATTSFPPETVAQGNFSSTSVGSAYDLSGIYAYVVPENSNNIPQYNSVPTPNSSCSGSSYGPISNTPNKTSVPGSTPCNFVLIGTSKGASALGSLTFAMSNPIGFTFVNDTGATTQYGLDGTQYTSELYVNGVYYANSPTFSNQTYVAPSNPKTTCTGRHNQNCTTTYQTPGTTGYSYSQSNLYGQCPQHNLYGSISAYSDANTNGYGVATTNTNIVPVQDSLNTYSTANEVLGYPPTHTTNHALIPFLGAVISQTVTETIRTPNNSTGGSTTTTSNTTYTVQAICPQWAIPAGATISAVAPAGTFSFTPTGYSAQSSPAVNVYATYYPDTAFTSTLYGNNIYPPVVAGCTPATNATDGGVTPTSSDPWWGADSPSNLGNCWLNTVSSSGNTTTTSLYQQSSANNNCAILIQPLGNAVPTSGSPAAPELPDYYTYVVKPGAFTGGTTGTTGNVNNIIGGPTPLGTPTNVLGTAVAGLNPYYDHSTYFAPTGATISSSKITVTTGTETSTSTGNGIPVGEDKIANSNSSATYPGSTTTNGTSSQYTVIETPAASGSGNDHNLPEDTSHRCYNPQANGIDGSSFTALGITNNDTSPATPADPVENPGLGAVLCNQNPPQSFALYWNDEGASAGDDLGYWNAVTVFTCPTPSSTTGGGPATLSG